MERWLQMTGFVASGTARRTLPAAGLMLAVTLSGCVPPLPETVASGQAAYDMFPTISVDDTVRAAVIGPNDTINISVFQEPDLSLKNAKVDSAGNLLVPLIGVTHVAGKTAPNLATEIGAKLGERYLRDPQVTVEVVDAVSQRVSVQGSVREAGVFPMTGRTTLLEAVAMAKGANDLAKLSEVVVFRRVGGERQAAVFNMTRIQRGIDPDPEVVGGDMVVVGFNNLKTGWRNVIGGAPILNVFRPF